MRSYLNSSCLNLKRDLNLSIWKSTVTIWYCNLRVIQVWPQLNSILHRDDRNWIGIAQVWPQLNQRSMITVTRIPHWVWTYTLSFENPCSGQKYSNKLINSRFACRLKKTKSSLKIWKQKKTFLVWWKKIKCVHILASLINWSLFRIKKHFNLLLIMIIKVKL